ncbi:STAS domain-containing protein, partial [Kitasatospora sp. A2-31]|uniref:STAS domain-containing protein n=1 Tax=Kitasatospora sp. A2-31 TaxID=2916414 RepID=UPI001EED780F
RRGPGPGSSTTMNSRPHAPFVVRAHGEIDLDTAPDLHDQLTRALTEHREVVLDLTEVTFMDCSGLNAIVNARNRADRQGAHLVLRGIGRPVARLLALTGLTRRLAPALCTADRPARPDPSLTTPSLTTPPLTTPTRTAPSLTGGRHPR